MTLSFLTAVLFVYLSSTTPCNVPILMIVSRVVASVAWFSVLFSPDCYIAALTFGIWHLSGFVIIINYRFCRNDAALFASL